MRCILLLYVGFALLVVLPAIRCSESDDSTSPPDIIDYPDYPEIDEHPSWSPDGLKIVYYHRGIVEINEHGGYRTDPDSSGLWMIDVNGNNAHIICQALYPVDAEWSQDGEWIAASVYSQIYKIRILGDHIDSTSIEQLTSKGRNFYPSWSPDGMWIVYDSNSKGLYSVWKMMNDGSHKEKLIVGRAPDWSPSEGNVAFTALSSHKLPEVFIIGAEGGDPIQLTLSGFGASCPEYSPDGSEIAFVSNKEIWIVSTDGSDLRFVIDSVISEGITWSPDGEEIAYVRFNPDNVNDNGTVWVVKTDGAVARQLTRGVPSKNSIPIQIDDF